MQLGPMPPWDEHPVASMHSMYRKARSSFHARISFRYSQCFVGKLLPARGRLSGVFSSDFKSFSGELIGARVHNTNSPGRRSLPSSFRSSHSELTKSQLSPSTGWKHDQCKTQPTCSTSANSVVEHGSVQLYQIAVKFREAVV